MMCWLHVHDAWSKPRVQRFQAGMNAGRQFLPHLGKEGPADKITSTWKFDNSVLLPSKYSPETPLSNIFYRFAFLHRHYHLLLAPCKSLPSYNTCTYPPSSQWRHLPHGLMLIKIRLGLQVFLLTWREAWPRTNSGNGRVLERGSRMTIVPQGSRLGVAAVTTTLIHPLE